METIRMNAYKVGAFASLALTLGLLAIIPSHNQEQIFETASHEVKISEQAQQLHAH